MSGATDQPNDFEMVDAVSSLRAHPEWYFKSGRFEWETMVSLLLFEAKTLTGGELSVEVNGSWTAVVAADDWLEGDESLFALLRPFPGGGANASRVEVLLSAFCDTVLTSAAGVSVVIRSIGEDELPEGFARLLTNPATGRVVVFRAPVTELGNALEKTLATPSFIRRSMNRWSDDLRAFELQDA